MKTLIQILSGAVLVLGLASHPAVALGQGTGPSAGTMNSAHYAIDWGAVNVAGGGTSTSAHFRLSSTMVQAAANTAATSLNAGLCTGFQCAPPSFRAFLPAVLRP